MRETKSRRELQILEYLASAPTEKSPRPEPTSTTAPRYFAPGGSSTVRVEGVGVVSLSDRGIVRSAGYKR